MFECRQNKSIRNKYWNDVTIKCETNLINSLENMSIRNRTYTVLNGFNCLYINEWSNTYTCILAYIEKSCKKYLCENSMYMTDGTL